MKNMKSISFIIALTLLVGMTAFGQNKTSKTVKKSIAVLELFTSEGCSSCPPADELMGKIQSEYKDSQVYVLAYHVDYWDKQGWKDVFSDADYTKRQYDYAKWLQKEPIYTPQVIVNGKTEHIASQETVVRNSIAKALSKPTVADISLKANRVKNTLTVVHNVTGASKNSRLLLAIVQKTAVSNVKRGENAHRILSHFQIVRHLHSLGITPESTGSTMLNLPKDYDAKNFEVIGFVQDMSNGTILGATKAIF